MFSAPNKQLAKLTLFLRFRKFNLVTMLLHLKIVMFYTAETYFHRFWIFKKSSTFALGKCGEICLLATTLKNAKNFHIVFLVSLHVFRNTLEFFIALSQTRANKMNLKYNAL